MRLVQHTADRAPLWSLNIGSIEWPHVTTSPSEMFDAEDILLLTVSFIGRSRARLREGLGSQRVCAGSTNCGKVDFSDLLEPLPVGFAFTMLWKC